MTLEQLKMLKAVIQEGSLQSASDRLFKTQPAISKGLQQLEASLGISLLDRSAYKLKLTKEGAVIYQKALLLLEQNDQLTQMAEHYKSGYEAEVTIAVDAMFDMTLLVPMFESIQQEFPNTQIILRQEYVTGGIDSVLNKRVQLAVTAAEPSFLTDLEIESIHINTQSLINVAAPKLIARHDKLCMQSQLKDEYQIIVQDSGSLSKDVELSVKQDQRKWYVNDFQSKRTLCLSGLGWGRLPHSIIKEDLKNGLLIPLDFTDSKKDVAVYSYVMKLKEKILGPVAQKLWDQIRALEK